MTDDYAAVPDDENERQAVKSLEGLEEYREIPEKRAVSVRDSTGEYFGWMEGIDDETALLVDESVFVEVER